MDKKSIPTPMRQRFGDPQEIGEAARAMYRGTDSFTPWLIAESARHVGVFALAIAEQFVGIARSGMG